MCCYSNKCMQQFFYWFFVSIWHWMIAKNFVCKWHGHCTLGAPTKAVRLGRMQCRLSMLCPILANRVMQNWLDLVCQGTLSLQYLIHHHFTAPPTSSCLVCDPCEVKSIHDVAHVLKCLAHPFMLMSNASPWFQGLVPWYTTHQNLLSWQSHIVPNWTHLRSYESRI